MDMDYCQYGCLYTKPTIFFFKVERLLSLCRKCSHQTHTRVLEGPGARPRRRWQARLGVGDLSCFPIPSLPLQACSDALGRHRPKLGLPAMQRAHYFLGSFEEVVRCFASECSKSERGRLELDAANGEWPPAQAPLPPLPAREPRPWPANAETWGRH